MASDHTAGLVTESIMRRTAPHNMTNALSAVVANERFRPSAKRVVKAVRLGLSDSGGTLTSPLAQMPVGLGEAPSYPIMAMVNSGLARSKFTRTAILMNSTTKQFRLACVSAITVTILFASIPLIYS